MGALQPPHPELIELGVIQREAEVKSKKLCWSYDFDHALITGKRKSKINTGKSYILPLEKGGSMPLSEKFGLVVHENWDL